MILLAARRLATLSLSFILLAFGLVSAGLPIGAAASGGRRSDSDRIARLAQLKVQLGSTRADQFNAALAELQTLDEPGSYDAWQPALHNPDPQLRQAAWRAFRGVQSELARKEFVPRVVRINTTPDEIGRIAAREGLEFTTWSVEAAGTVVAAPPYLVDALPRYGLSAEIIFDSVAEWQRARERGDARANAVTPGYQAAGADRSAQVRIAVIDLGKRLAPDAGYATWLGDRENVLMQRDSLIAYLDVFTADGSAASIKAHIEEQYTRRGFALAGFFTTDEFSVAAPRLFGEEFNFGGRPKERRPGDVRTVAADAHYHTYDQAQSEFKAIAAAHPDLAAYAKLGQSYEGRDIFALKITRGAAAADDASKPDVLVTGCHHAREWISVESPIYFANQLVDNYATDSLIHQTLDQMQIWIVPIVNPDGLVYSQSAAPGSSDGTRLWRKNRRPMNLGSCASAVGADLNRNYEFQWRLRGDTTCDDFCSSDRSCINDDVGASDDPANFEIYRGPRAASEPEVKVMQALISDPSHHFRAELDYHNFGQLILYPWGYQHDATPDAALQAQMVQQMSDEIKKVSGRSYHAEQAIDLYQVTGSSMDFAYGSSGVALPITVEMRPTCCDFDLSEDQIPGTNAENWAAVLPILNWAAGPPILQSVKAYSIGTDGRFSKLVYSASWALPTDGTSGSRRLTVDWRFPGIAPGNIQVRLQFSKSMRTALAPRATLGRDGNRDELTLVATNSDEGWQKTVYDNDTWVGETTIVQDDNLTSPWRLYAAAPDTAGFNLDGDPATIASYATGTGKWQAYEDGSDGGTGGGTDSANILAPTLRGDFPDIFVASPGGGERVVAGEAVTAAWTLPRQSGFQTAQQELYLSIDDGVHYARVASSLPANLEAFSLSLPIVSTTAARLRVVAIDGATGNALIGDSRANFTIGMNVGGSLDLRVAASERQDLNWSDSASAPASSGSLRLAIDLQITNRGTVAIANPFVRVAGLSRSQVLLTRDPQSPPGVGARQAVDAGEDGLLAPGESAQVQLVLGLVSKKKFAMSIETYGVAVGGTINPAAAVQIWTGKPRNQ